MMTFSDYLLILVVIFCMLLYPLFKKAVSLGEIFVNNYLQNTTASSGKQAAAKTLLNLKLLAYERILLFVERMKPDSLIPRTLQTNLTNGQYHRVLLEEIRNEYEYNLSQQLYLSENAWLAASTYKENLITLIDTAATECKLDNKAGELAKKILEHYLTSDLKPDRILQIIKSDIK